MHDRDGTLSQAFRLKGVFVRPDTGSVVNDQPLDQLQDLHPKEILQPLDPTV